MFFKILILLFAGKFIELPKDNILCKYLDDEGKFAYECCTYGSQNEICSIEIVMMTMTRIEISLRYNLDFNLDTIEIYKVFNDSVFTCLSIQ